MSTIWRIDLAQKLAECIAPFDGVQAIIVAGSVARNYADAYSDLELPIFWDMLPDDAKRHAVVNKLNASFLHSYDGPAAEDQLLINGVQVDLWHITVAEEEALIEAVLTGQNLDLGSLNAMDTLRSCIPIYGHKIIAELKEKVQAYPDRLAEQIIQEYISSFKVAGLFLLAIRDNPAAFYGQLSSVHQALFLVLLALNRRYFPAFKWMFRALETMPIKPENIDRRLRQAFKSSYFEAIADTREILEETLELVEQQFPHLDTAPVRRQLVYTRTGHWQPKDECTEF